MWAGANYNNETINLFLFFVNCKVKYNKDNRNRHKAIQLRIYTHIYIKTLWEKRNQNYMA